MCLTNYSGGQMLKYIYYKIHSVWWIHLHSHRKLYTKSVVFLRSIQRFHIQSLCHLKLTDVSVLLLGLQDQQQ